MSALSAPQARAADLAVCALFALFAFTFTAGRAGSMFGSFCLLTGDAANYATVAAALDEPALLGNDPSFGDPENFRFLRMTVYLPLLRVGKAVLGNYGSALIALLPAVVFLQLLGFYLLGAQLYASRAWGLILALISFVTVFMNLGDLWGFWFDPLPRILFQALLPFLLAAVLRWGDRLRAWPVILGATGLLVYVHAISAAAWSVAMIFAFWAVPHPGETPARKRAVFSAALAALLVAGAPFAWNYFSGTVFGGRVEGHREAVDAVVQSYFGAGYANPIKGLREFIALALSPAWAAVPLWALAAFAALQSARPGYREAGPTPWRLRALGAWWAGILLVATLPVVDRLLAHALDRMPLEVSLIRNLRYVFPLLLVSALLPLVRLGGAAGLRRLAALALGAALTVTWAKGHSFFESGTLANALGCWRRGQLLCAPPGTEDFADLMSAIGARTPPGARIMIDGKSLLLDIQSPDAVRYFALRPLAFSFKDSGILTYANPAALVAWDRQAREYRRIIAIADDGERARAHVDFARRAGARFVVLRGCPEPEEVGLPPGLAPAHRNATFALYPLE